MEENYKQFQRVTDRLITYLRFRDNERKQGEDEVWEKILFFFLSCHHPLQFGNSTGYQIHTRMWINI